MRPKTGWAAEVFLASQLLLLVSCTVVMADNAERVGLVVEGIPTNADRLASTRRPSSASPPSRLSSNRPNSTPSCPLQKATISTPNLRPYHTRPKPSHNPESFHYSPYPRASLAPPR